jgi:hypothetical protein
MDAFMKQAEKKEKEELRAKLQQLLDNSNMSKVKQRRLFLHSFSIFLLPYLEYNLRVNPKKNMVYNNWDPMPEFTTTSPYVHSRVDSNTFNHGQPYARVYLKTLRDFGFGL